ncbi:uncharacterized protein LOC141601184 [Silene latifolia]|uniref:uncharacterized protein LOC141601184 n=1 Tax=Silene latifolia TaxID=37657 RepID=UPI003D785CB1
MLAALLVRKEVHIGSVVKIMISVVTRMSPSLIINFIKSNPSEKQIEAIKSMGFGESLKLQSEEIHGHLARWIVESFNPFSCSLMNGDLTITDEDVYLVTGIPMGPLDINPLVIIPKTRILSRSSDLADVPKFNWCKLARVNMIENVISWKKAAAKDPGTSFKGPILIFCLIYLDRVVFKTRTVVRSFPLLANWSDERIRERVKMEKHDANCFGEGRVEDRFVYKPPVSETDKRVDDAVTTQGKENVEGAGVTTKGKGKVEDPEEGGPVHKKTTDCIKVLAGTAVTLADCYGAFSKAVMQAKFVVPHMEAVTKMSTLADSLFEGFSLSQQSKEESEMEEEERKDEEKDDHELEQDERNDEGTVEDKFDKVKEKDDHEMEEEERKDESKVEEGKKYVDYMDSDEFYNDPNILADLEGILNSAYNRVGEAFKEHQVTKEKMDKELMEGPSFSLFHGEDALYTSQEFREAQRPGDMCDVPHASTSTAPVIPSPPRATMSATPSIPSPPRGSTPAAPSIHSPPRASTSAAPSNPSPASPILISSQLSLNESPIMPSSPLVELSPTVPSQTRKCKRKVELPDVFRSPFFIRNVNVMDALSQSEKLMGDYAFAADLDEGEVLFQ